MANVRSTHESELKMEVLVNVGKIRCGKTLH